MSTRRVLTVTVSCILLLAAMLVLALVVFVMVVRAGQVVGEEVDCYRWEVVIDDEDHQRVRDESSNLSGEWAQGQSKVSWVVDITYEDGYVLKASGTIYRPTDCEIPTKTPTATKTITPTVTPTSSSTSTPTNTATPSPAAEVTPEITKEATRVTRTPTSTSVAQPTPVGTPIKEVDPILLPESGRGRDTWWAYVILVGALVLGAGIAIGLLSKER